MHASIHPSMHAGRCLRVHEAMCLHHHGAEEPVRGLKSGQQCCSRDNCSAAHRNDDGDDAARTHTCSGRCDPTHPALQVVEGGREGGGSTALLYYYCMYLMYHYCSLLSCYHYNHHHWKQQRFYLYILYTHHTSYAIDACTHSDVNHHQDLQYNLSLYCTVVIILILQHCCYSCKSKLSLKESKSSIEK